MFTAPPQDSQLILAVCLLEWPSSFFGYRDILDTFKHDRMELISRTEVTVDHSMRLSEMFGNYIRVPFETIPVDRTKYYCFGTIKVVVTTPQQGNFEAFEDLVRLYPES